MPETGLDPTRVEEVTAALVALPSHGGRERATLELVKVQLEAAGCECVLQDVSVGRPNLLAWRGHAGPFLCTHADTQPPFGHPDPYKCWRDGEVLVGRGVLDAKGQIAAIVAAVESTREPVRVVITCDEEVGGSGSEKLELPDAMKPDVGGIVLEPTGFRVCTAQAGNIEVRLEVLGLPVHMAEPERGANALALLDEALEALALCGFMRATHPLFPAPWRHVGRLAGGEHLWRTPGRATAETSLSILPGVPGATARTEVERVLDAVGARFKALGAELRYEIPDVNEAIELPSGLAILDRLRDAFDGPFEASGMRSWTDAAYLYLLHEVPCVVFGAGELAPAHSDREWVRLEDLVRLAATLRRLIDG